MNKFEIMLLIRFNFWANARILAASEQISRDAFTREITPDPGWGSLRGILVHTLDAEYGWRTVMQAQDSTEVLQEESFEDVAALKTRWDRESAAWFEHISGLEENSINQINSTDPQSGMTVWQTILHVVTHGIQHRSEAAAILTGYRQSPGELDFDIFLLDNTDLSSD